MKAYKTESGQTYYDVLEVSANASSLEIQAAYQKLKKAYSPDSPALYTMFTPEEANELLKLIEEAYSVLSNRAKRESYDRDLSLASGKKSAHPEKQNNVHPLPDFYWPEENQRVSQARHPQPTSMASGSIKNDGKNIPEGFAKTKFSVYEVDEEFEKELEEVSEVDGNLLQRIRLYKQINLDSISEETKISRTYLAAVENNDYAALPAPVFVRGFVTQFVRLLGLNEKKFTDAYMRLFKQQAKID